MSRVLPVLDPPDMRTTSIHKLEKPSLLASSDRRELILPTRKRPLIVSASELGSFLRCRVRHHWESQCKLEPNGVRLPLAIGKVGHNILEKFYKFDYVDRTPERMAKIAKVILKKTDPRYLPLKEKQLVQAMVIGYAEWNRNKKNENSDVLLKLRSRLPEKEFILPLDDEGTVWVRGRMDLLFEPKSYKNTLAFIESKFKSQIKWDNVEQKIQLSVYIWAMWKLFPEYDRYIAFPQVLRKQMPGPRVKADLFARQDIERNKSELAQWAIDTHRTALDMIDGAVYASPMDSCSWSCDFQKPCLLRGNKKDLKYVLKDNYHKRKWSK